MDAVTLMHKLSRKVSMWRVAVAVSMLVIVGCGTRCDETYPQAPRFYQYGDDYALQLTNVIIVSPDGAIRRATVVPTMDSSGDRFDGEPLAGSVLADWSAFWITLRNVSAAPSLIDWLQARFVDERGVSHDVFRQPLGPLPDPDGMRKSEPVTLASGAQTRDSVAPIDKSYWVVEDCRNHVPFREPLVPARFRDQSESEMRRHIEALAHSDKHVELVVPVSTGTKLSTYRFQFSLRRR